MKVCFYYSGLFLIPETTAASDWSDWQPCYVYSVDDTESQETYTLHKLVAGAASSGVAGKIRLFSPLLQQSVFMMGSSLLNWQPDRQAVLAYWSNWPQDLKWTYILKREKSFATSNVLVNYSPRNGSSTLGTTTCPLGVLAPKELQTAQPDLIIKSQLGNIALLHLSIQEKKKWLELHRHLRNFLLSLCQGRSLQNLWMWDLSKIYLKCLVFFP